MVTSVGQSTAIGNSESTNYKLAAGFLSIDFSIPQVPDQDHDGVPDASDNCTLVPNLNQLDTDNDKYGNMCDADLNNNGIVNNIDLAAFKRNFLTRNPDADFDGNGIVNNLDLAILKKMFLKAPGPSGLK